MMSSNKRYFGYKKRKLSRVNPERVVAKPVFDFD